MRALIFLGLIAVALSSVSCKENRFFRRENNHQKKFRFTKNKRGISDYPFNLPFTGSSFANLQLAPVQASPAYSHGVSALSGYGSHGSASLISNALGQNSYNLQAQLSPGLSSYGSQNLANLDNHNALKQTLNLGNSAFGQSTGGIGHAGLGQIVSNFDNSAFSQTPSVLGNSVFGQAQVTSNLGNSAFGHSATNLGNTVYNQPSASTNFASILGGQSNTLNSYSPSSLGLFSPEKTGQIAILSQGSTYGSPSSIHKPLLISPSQLGANYAVVLGQGDYSQGHQALNLAPSTLSNTINSLISHNRGASYGLPASLLSQSASNTPSTNYVIAPSATHPGESGSSYSMQSLVASPSSPTYTISVPSSSYLTYNLSSSSNSPTSNNYQLSMSSSPQSSPSSSFTGKDFSKYVPASSEGSTYANHDSHPRGVPMKLSHVNSGMNFVTPSSVNSLRANSHSMKSSFPHSSHSHQTKHTLNSYGQPVMSYSFPSTSYGIPSQSSYSSSLNSHTHKGPFAGRGQSSDSSAFTHLKSVFPSSSSSFQSDFTFKGPENNFRPGAMPYSDAHSNFRSPSNAQFTEESPFKDLPTDSISTLSNSIDFHSSQEPSSLFEEISDSGSSYSSYYPRYQKYPTKSLFDNAESNADSTYDTISYSVPNRK
ncbi:uncharacterized serine-rich protein C215.13-like [Trichogramma pretiosum]|uniref:uncharacterized serine-rich protein C215.13-like n=1 Tax=Trichogramma pretiosum TaxID=7493 RepID=UPI0006C94682|nr:uncharacterized serine-rich protein C215.13-like [Trichogramma pretiosum]